MTITAGGAKAVSVSASALVVVQSLHRRFDAVHVFVHTRLRHVPPFVCGCRAQSVNIITELLHPGARILDFCFLRTPSFHPVECLLHRIYPCTQVVYEFVTA